MMPLPVPLPRLVKNHREVQEMNNPTVAPKQAAKLKTEQIKRSAGIGSNAIQRTEDAAHEFYARTAQESTELNRKLVEIAHANLHAHFELLTELLSVKSPADFTLVAVRYWKRQGEIYRQWTHELFNALQKAGIENLGPLGTSVGNALIGRPDLS